MGCRLNIKRVTETYSVGDTARERDTDRQRERETVNEKESLPNLGNRDRDNSRKTRKESFQPVKRRFGMTTKYPESDRDRFSGRYRQIETESETENERDNEKESFPALGSIYLNHRRRNGQSEIQRHSREIEKESF